MLPGSARWERSCIRICAPVLESIFSHNAAAISFLLSMLTCRADLHHHRNNFFFISCTLLSGARQVLMKSSHVYSPSQKILSVFLSVSLASKLPPLYCLQFVCTLFDFYLDCFVSSQWLFFIFYFLVRKELWPEVMGTYAAIEGVFPLQRTDSCCVRHPR